MAQGKNKKNLGKKGQKKKTVDPLSRKEWFQLQAPAPFQAQHFGYTCANRTMGLKKVEDNVRGRVVSQIQSDLAPNQDAFCWRKIKLIVDNIQPNRAITSFYGIDTTRDEVCSLIKKKKTLIEAVQDVKSNDGYLLRIFSIAFTKQSPQQKRKTNYALSSQQKEIRRRICEIISKEVAKSNATQIMSLFTSDIVEKKITKEVSRIYPVKNVKIRKIKVIQRSKIDVHKLTQMHDPEKRTLIKNAFKKQDMRGKRDIRQQDTDVVNLLHK